MATLHLPLRSLRLVTLQLVTLVIVLIVILVIVRLLTAILVLILIIVTDIPTLFTGIPTLVFRVLVIRFHLWMWLGYGLLPVTWRCGVDTALPTFSYIPQQRRTRRLTWPHIQVKTYDGCEKQGKGDSIPHLDETCRRAGNDSYIALAEYA